MLAKISIYAFHRDVSKRIANVERALGSLKQTDGEYINEYKALLRMYYDVDDIIKRHE
jgi:hypothetical protein